MMDPGRAEGLFARENLGSYQESTASDSAMQAPNLTQQMLEDGLL